MVLQGIQLAFSSPEVFYRPCIAAERLENMYVKGTRRGDTGSCVHCSLQCCSIRCCEVLKVCHVSPECLQTVGLHAPDCCALLKDGKQTVSVRSLSSESLDCNNLCFNFSSLHCLQRLVTGTATLPCSSSFMRLVCRAICRGREQAIINNTLQQSSEICFIIELSVTTDMSLTLPPNKLS